MEEKTLSFMQLTVWQKAHEFVLKVYKLTANFPKHEIFSLSMQFRRAAVSIAANIAEGYIKRTKPDKVKFFNISQGSLEECRYYTLLSKDLQYILINDYEILNTLSSDISKLLTSYIKKIQNDYTQK